MTSTTTPNNPGSRRSVLLIGLAPTAVDLGKFPGHDEATLRAGLKSLHEEVVAAGYDAARCLAEATWETAEPQLSAKLAERSYDAIMIGAGIRTIPDHFLLFEKIINLVHARAPDAKICFNTSPDTTVAALRRWLP